jgi:transcriptional regulator with XRE-family HTH domain
MGGQRYLPPGPELKTFSKRLRAVMKFKKIDAASLAKATGYAVADINRLLAGMREPSLKKLILLANSLKCSVDYLLGLADEALRVSDAVITDTDAIKPELVKRGQASGQREQISGDAKQLAAGLSELPKSDVELLLRIAGFLIERRKKGMLELVKAITAAPQKDAAPEKETSAEKVNGKAVSDDFDSYVPHDDIEFDDGLDDDDYYDDNYDDDGDDDDYDDDNCDDDDDDYDDYERYWEGE